MTEIGAFETPCIIGAMIWYRQTPERLRKCVLSLKDRCQGVVALDGPYAGLAAEESSPDDNYDAIANAADDIGIRWDIFEGQAWVGEPQKRTAAAREALAMAASLGPGAEPWVLVIDSDEWIASDIDAEAVSAYGHGSARMQSYRDCEQTADGGTGSKMVRLIPNTPHLLWGPAHFDLRDMSIPKTYSGWEKALANEDVPAFELGHDLGTKVIQAEYDSYNDVRRAQAEGKMMRIVDDYERGDQLVIRMDNEQIAANGWKAGVVISIGGPLLGQEESGHAVVMDVVPLEGHEDLISDIILARVDEEQAEALSKVMVEAEIERRVLQQALLSKRIAKRSRQAERAKRRYG